MTKNTDVKPQPIPSPKEIMVKEYPTIYNGYKQIMDEQFELFIRKHLDYWYGEYFSRY
jgi:hypothetical protein